MLSFDAGVFIIAGKKLGCFSPTFYDIQKVCCIWDEECVACKNVI